MINVLFGVISKFVGLYFRSKFFLLLSIYLCKMFGPRIKESMMSGCMDQRPTHVESASHLQFATSSTIPSVPTTLWAKPSLSSNILGL